jgi:hypothetical protein
MGHRCFVAAIVCALILALPSRGSAHDVPNDVTVVVFVKPAGQRLSVVIRLPLPALNPNGYLFSRVAIPKRADGFVDLASIDTPLVDAARVLANLFPLYEGHNGLVMQAVRAVRLSLQDDRSFASYDGALAHTTGAALPIQTNLPPDEGFFDAALEYSIDSDQSDFSIQPQVSALAGRVLVTVRFLPAGGGVRAYELTGGSGEVRLDPRWYHAAFGFVEGGFTHILSGADHLLFLLCLVLPLRRLRALIPVITAFTVAHSVALIASAYNLAPGGAWFPPTIETLIAASILYMALENMVVANPPRRWVLTFMFGLVHGFGFSFALRETLQFAGSHLLLSLLSFNVGVEIGQLFVLSIAVPALALLFRRAVPERGGVIVLSAMIAHLGWDWVVDRWDRLSRIDWSPSIQAALPWLLAVIFVASLLWLMNAIYRRKLHFAGQEPVEVS